MLRSGRLDRKIEFPHPNEEARARIMQIHSRKMNISSCVNFEELARSTDDFNGAQCKAVCVEAVSYIQSYTVRSNSQLSETLWIPFMFCFLLHYYNVDIARK